MKSLSPKEWNRRKAAHLMNRAGFGGSPAEIDAWSERDPREIVDELIAFTAHDAKPTPPAWAIEGADRGMPSRSDMQGLSEEQRRQKVLQLQQNNRRYISELRAWWLYQMRYTSAPLREKMTLFWHGHFATGFRKVRGAYLMYLQNQTFREKALGNWEEMLLAVSQDPAMLIYLDNARSNRRQPNENYARELMELFALGEGHYTEEDIREAARAFTGWTLSPDRASFREVRLLHDSGRKTFFGQTGAFTGRDIVRLVAEHPESPRFICRKLWSFFAYESPEEEVITALARELRAPGNNLAAVMRSMLLSEAFYSEKAIRTQIKSPVQWFVQSLKTLEAPMPAPVASIAALNLLGQDLFEPPNVKGWDGGAAWITASSLVQRYNLAAALVKGGRALTDSAQSSMRDMAGTPGSPMERFRSAIPLLQPVADASRLRASIQRATTHEQAYEWLAQRLFQDPLRDKDRQAILARWSDFPAPCDWSDTHIREALHQLMSTPHFQLT